MVTEAHEAEVPHRATSASDATALVTGKCHFLLFSIGLEFRLAVARFRVWKSNFCLTTDISLFILFLIFGRFQFH